ncbi:hypothetical protein [Streptomyces sp. Ru73]|uniref:effector-associated constant component EACC1 n=1 Tax=Streptomyces sp. Ru73 TaxID=2080748 RepID=UPI000CDDBD0C|nr:hypothetical protein [Streptomyces sp. Ru73]
MWALIPEIAAGLGAGISAVATSLAFRVWRGKRKDHPTVVLTRQSGDVRITVSGADAEQVRRALASLDGESGTGSAQANGDGSQAGARQE